MRFAQPLSSHAGAGTWLERRRPSELIERGHNDRRDAIATEAVASTTLTLPLTHQGVTWLERRRPSRLKGVVTMTAGMPLPLRPSHPPPSFPP